MPDIQCSSCKATMPGTAKFCPECGSPPEMAPPAKLSPAKPKRKSSKVKLRRQAKAEKRAAFWAHVRLELIDTASALSVIIVMPVIIIALSNWIGVIAAWLAIGIAMIYAVFNFWPNKFPMGNSKPKARLTCVMALVSAVAAFYFGGVSDELSSLKKNNVGAYLEKLREYKGDNEWLAAVKELTPENYAAAVTQTEREKKEAEQKASRDAQKKHREEAKERLEKRAITNAITGYPVNPTDFGGQWYLKPQQARLRCKLGPVAGSTPRPLVLLDADNKIYALNGAALSTGEYEDGRNLAVEGNIQTIRDLISIGIKMCEARAKSECGTEARAYDYAEQAVLQRLKNPADADVSMLHATTTMKSCGVWLVKSYVDATNGLGATIRTHFAAEMTRSPDGQWTGKVHFEQ